MVADARDLGIPASAIPQLPTNPTEAELRAARDRLAGMIASFLSSGLLPTLAGFGTHPHSGGAEFYVTHASSPY